MAPENLIFTREHEWVKKEEGKALIGISDYAQEELGDIVFVELPDIGAAVKKGDSPVTLESVKAVSSVYSPYDGVITAVNTKLTDEPELINNSPYDDGWIFEMTITGSDDEKLMDSDGYRRYTDELD